MMATQTQNKKTAILSFLAVALFLFNGCSTSQVAKKTMTGNLSPGNPSLTTYCTPISYTKKSASAPARPPWTLVEPGDENGIHFLIGMSGFHATERDARGEAMNHARSEFAKYTGVAVKELNTISREIYGKSSSILDPTITGKSLTTQETDATVRRTRAREWYFEKLMKRCQNKDRGIAYQVWVLAEVPSEEFDKIQEWKANRLAAKEAKIVAARKAIKLELEEVIKAHQLTLEKVRTLMEIGDPIAALGLLQSAWSRLYDEGEIFEQKDSDTTSQVQHIYALQREIPDTVRRLRAALIIDPGRDATVWVPVGLSELIEIPVWLWYRYENQVLATPNIPLILKARDGTNALAKGRSNREGKLVFRLNDITPGEYEVTLDSKIGALSTLDPALKKAMSVVEVTLTVVAYPPNIANATRAGIRKLFDGPAMKTRPINKVVMGSVRYGDTRQGSAFGRRLEKEIEQEIAKMTSLTLIKKQEKRDTRSLSATDKARGIGMTKRPAQSMGSPAMQALIDGADGSLEASYSLEGEVVRLDLRLNQAKTGKILAASGVSINKSSIPNHFDLSPPKVETTIPEIVPEQEGEIILELTTQRGDSATFSGGEKIFYYVSTNQDAYLLLVYVDAEGNVIQLFPNQNSGDGYRPAGDYMSIPDEQSTFDFEITSPYGVEQVWAFAASEPFPGLKGSGLSNGLKVLDQNLTGLASALRIHGKKEGIRYGEANVIITTVKE